MSATDKLGQLVRYFMRDVKYHKHYGATVQRQLGETVDLLPDDPSLRGSGLSGVKIMHGLPGVAVTVLPGTRMTLYFENGDPQEPRAALWEGGHVEVKFNNGSMPVARVGDAVTITNVSSIVAPPSGGPCTGVASGTITGGAPTLKA